METKELISLDLLRKNTITNIFQCLTVVALLATGGCSTLSTLDRHSATVSTLDRSTLDRHSVTVSQLQKQAEPNTGYFEMPGQALLLQSSGDMAQPELRVPYPIRVSRALPGGRATASRDVQLCPAGSLRYCDHRQNRCGCVDASRARKILQNRPGF